MLPSLKTEHLYSLPRQLHSVREKPMGKVAKKDNVGELQEDKRILKEDTPTVTLSDEGMVNLDWTMEQAKRLCGSDNLKIAPIINQILQATPRPSEEMLTASLAMLAEIEPRNGLEAMLAAQMIAVHNISLECGLRCSLREQTPHGFHSGINDMTKLMRTFTAQMEALQRYRNGGKQKIMLSTSMSRKVVRR